MEKVKNLIIIVEAVILLGGAISWVYDEISDQKIRDQEKNLVKELVTKQDSLIKAEKRAKVLLNLRLSTLEGKKANLYKRDSIINAELLKIDTMNSSSSIHAEIDKIYQESEKY